MASNKTTSKLSASFRVRALCSDQEGDNNARKIFGRFKVIYQSSACSHYSPARTMSSIALQLLWKKKLREDTSISFVCNILFRFFRKIGYFVAEIKQRNNCDLLEVHVTWEAGCIWPNVLTCKELQSWSKRREKKNNCNGLAFTVETHLTVTSLIRPPRYYRHFILARTKTQTVIFSFKEPLKYGHPVNTARFLIIFVAGWWSD